MLSPVGNVVTAAKSAALARTNLLMAYPSTYRRSDPACSYPEVQRIALLQVKKIKRLRASQPGTARRKPRISRSFDGTSAPPLICPANQEQAFRTRTRPKGNPTDGPAFPAQRIRCPGGERTRRACAREARCHSPVRPGEPLLSDRLRHERLCLFPVRPPHGRLRRHRVAHPTARSRAGAPYLHN